MLTRTLNCLLWLQVTWLISHTVMQYHAPRGGWRGNRAVTGVIFSQGMLIWIVLNIAVMMPVLSHSHAHPLPWAFSAEQSVAFEVTLNFKTTWNCFRSCSQKAKNLYCSNLPLSTVFSKSSQLTFKGTFWLVSWVFELCIAHKKLNCSWVSSPNLLFLECSTRE